jgi:capsular polysaccharide biosynthesis protein
VAARSTVFDSSPPIGTQMAAFSPSAIGIFRNLCVQDMISSDTTRSVKGKVFFMRNSRQRRVINIGVLEKVANARGFRSQFDDVNLYKNQVSIFNETEVALLSGGAMCANMLFMKKGSKVIILESSRSKGLDLWKKLANALEINFYGVSGYPTYWGRNSLRRIHTNFYISKRMLRKILSEVTMLVT